MTTIAPSIQRYAVIAQLAQLYSKKGASNLGKTALQKLIYFLQVVHGVDLGYEYTLYTYGPFSTELVADLDTAAQMNLVLAVYDPGIGGYEIKPGESVDALQKQSREFMKTVTPKLEAVFNTFRDSGAKSLELRATIVYVDREARADQVLLDDDTLVSEVHRLKPHFTEQVIREAISELRKIGYLGKGANGKAEKKNRGFWTLKRRRRES
jgi:uncharacterized protein YwgA